MRVVVDTNVRVSALISPSGPPGRVIDAVRDGRIEALASWDLAEEIAEVLRRPRIRRFLVGEPDVRDVLLLLAPLLPRTETDVPVRDPDDLPVVASALAGRADCIVTGDEDLLGDAALRALLAEKGVEVLTPAELAARLPPPRPPRPGAGAARRGR